MHNLVHSAIELIKHHAQWALPVLFVVSFGESFVGISLLFPGTTIMVIAGTFARWWLNPDGVLSIWPLLVGSIAGAVTGDAISFYFGRRFGHMVERHWYFQRHPQLLRRGYAYFERFGVASVFVGRFFGPVRAVIPLVAGIMEMSWRQFWVANIASAFIWAPALLFLGTVLTVLSRVLGAPQHWHLTVGICAAIVLMVVVWALEHLGVLARLKRTWQQR